MKEDEDGKRSVFEPLIIDHHVRLRAYVRSLGVAPDWVDDLAQEAFLIAYKEWNSFDQSRDFGNWIRAIALNLVRNELRKDARRRRILHTDLTDHLLKTMHDAGDRLESLTIDAVRKCLGLLPPKLHAVVLGRYRDSESTDQLAARFGVSKVNIRQMLLRCRKRIGRCVDEQIRGQKGLA